MSPLAQAPPITFWGVEPFSAEMWVKIAVTLVVCFGLIFAISGLPAKGRKFVVGFFTFVAGLFYVLLRFVPQPVSLQSDEVPLPGEQFGAWLQEALPRIADSANIITAFLVGLGVYSVLRVHLGRIFKRQPDREFSVVLLVSMVLMASFGYADWIMRRFGEGRERLEFMQNWTPIQYGFDLMFDGLLQQMDAAMFSMIAFFILSAAYRAFRIRSVESTVLMGSALILMLSLLGALVSVWNTGMDSAAVAIGLSGANVELRDAGFLNNFKLNEIAGWVRGFLQVPALRALEFGVGLGALAMGLRLWLGLEKGGIST